MTDSTLTDDSGETSEEFLEDDSRAQLCDSIADLLAELSEATDTPDGIQTCSAFSANDVIFETDAWANRLGDVQGWLRFSDDLPLTGIEPFAVSLAARLGFEGKAEGIEQFNGTLRLSEAALERLRERAELAARFQHEFHTTLNTDGASRSSATISWSEWWEAEDGNAESVAPEPVTAKADVWHIFQLTKKKLNLTPSYQRGDVWRTGDRQALIESILRGIPLPSIILLRTGGTTPHDVVDGKQRLTAILRFVGQHPIALAKVVELDKLHPSLGLRTLFETDYPKFRATWRKIMTYPLTSKLEDDLYFPFKLRNDSRGGLVGPDLEPLRGKYYTQIRDNTIHVADQEVTVEDLFGGAPDYKVPVIEYTKASQRQIHEVFKLYNKQGMHLNAEEIRNAVYHDIELTRAILVAAGDASSRNNIAEIAPSLVGVEGIDILGKTLGDYGFGEARYRRTKVLGWVVSVLVNDSNGKLLPSTARYTDLLLGQIQENEKHALRDPIRIADLFRLIAYAVDLHASHDELWPAKFRGDGKSAKWQDLQLVGSLVGVAIAAAGSPDDIEDRMKVSADRIRKAAIEEWRRPAKTQTRTQWDYIGRIAQGVIETLDVDITVASENIRARFGSSGVESLLGSILSASD